MVDRTTRSDDFPLLELRGVRKEFPSGTVALHGVDISVEKGSIHGLVGANGAGKSTLIKVLAGAVSRSGGIIRWRGDEVTWRRPVDAQAAGLATVFQNTPLVSTLSVLENVFLGRRGGILRDPAAVRSEYRQLVERIGYRLDPDKLVSELSIGARQMVAILQALGSGADLVIMDEPTASLAQTERNLVFDIVRRLSSSGTTFIYVSHFLNEILDLCDKVTVLRDGRVVLDEDRSQITEENLVTGIVGDKLRAVEATNSATIQSSEVALEVRGVRSVRSSVAVSFQVRVGEIVGLAGLLGSGRSEILHAIYGADRRTEGTISLHGRAVHGSAAAAVRAGMALVPEDRDQQGLIANWEIWRNTSLPDIQDLAIKRTIPSMKRELDRARRAFHDLSVKAPGPDTEVSDLSGGNAQKVVFAKWLYGNATLFLLDEPTAGVDIGAKAEILELVRQFAREGKSVVIVSSEFEELLAVANRVLVVHGGKIIAERESTATTEHELVGLVSGLG